MRVGTPTLATAATAAVIMLVSVIALTLIMLQNQQSALDAEIEARTAGLCEGTVQGRATQVLFGEILIRASTEGEELDAEDRRTIDAFRKMIDESIVGQFPPQCVGVMSRDEFRRRVHTTAQRLAADGASDRLVGYLLAGPPSWDPATMAP
jgi:hypothetical protein